MHSTSTSARRTFSTGRRLALSWGRSRPACYLSALPRSSPHHSPLLLAPALQYGVLPRRGVMVAAFFGQAVPFFWLALILVLIFAVKLHVLPATGSLQSVGWTALILPVVALVVPNVATLSRLVRGQVVDVLAQPFVVTATSKGLPFRKVMRRHVIPNAVPPIISWIAIQFSFLLGATIIIEPIFNYQGIGTLMIQAVTNGDYSIVEAGVFFFALFVIGANLAADMLNHSLDPRLRVATH